MAVAPQEAVTMARFIKNPFGLALLASVGISFFTVAQAQVPIYAGSETNASSDLLRVLQTPKMAPLKFIASTDKTGGNDDFVWLKPGETKRVPLPVGSLERFWSTSLFPDQLDLSLQTGPNRILKVLSNGKATAGLYKSKAYSLHPDLKHEVLRQLKAESAIIVTNRAKDPAKWYYQATVRPNSNQSVPPLPVVREVAKRQFKVEVGTGETKVIENWENPGMIYALEVAVTDGSPPGIFENLRLKMSFDGVQSVDAPLLSLAGQQGGSGFLNNAVCDFDGGRLLLRWPMPFKTATMALENKTDQTLKLDVMVRVQLHKAEPSVYRFCAIEKSAQTVKGKPVDILDVKGEGAFAGLALAIEPKSDSPTRSFAYLEGDERITADGVLYEGTGTEDYFTSAWYFPDKPFFHPYDGMTSKTAMPPTVAAYRFHIPDAINFSKSLDFDFEVGNGNNRDDLIWKWTAIWYQKSPASIEGASLGNGIASNIDQKSSTERGISLWFLLFPIGVLGVVILLARKIRH
jgi:hypothetical protein